MPIAVQLPSPERPNSVIISCDLTSEIPRMVEFSMALRNCLINDYAVSQPWDCIEVGPRGLQSRSITINPERVALVEKALEETIAKFTAAYNVTVTLVESQLAPAAKVSYNPQLAVMGDDRYCKDLNFVVNTANRKLIALVVSCSQVFNVIKDNYIQKFIDLLTAEFKTLGCEVIFGKFTITLTKKDNGFLLDIRSEDFAKVLACYRSTVNHYNYQSVMQAVPFINLLTIENLVTRCFNYVIELQRTGSDILAQASRYDLLALQSHMAMDVVEQPRDAKRTHSRMSPN